MKNIITKTLLSITSAMAITSCGQAPQMIQTPTPQSALQIQSTQQTPEFLIQFNQDAHKIILDRFFQKYNLQLVKILPGLNTHVVRFKSIKGIKVERAIMAMQNELVVSHIEENHQVRVSPIFEMGIFPIIRR